MSHQSFWAADEGNEIVRVDQSRAALAGSPRAHTCSGRLREATGGRGLPSLAPQRRYSSSRAPESLAAALPKATSRCTLPVYAYMHIYVQICPCRQNGIGVSWTDGV